MRVVEGEVGGDRVNVCPTLGFANYKREATSKNIILLVTVMDDIYFKTITTQLYSFKRKRRLTVKRTKQSVVMD